MSDNGMGALLFVAIMAFFVGFDKLAAWNRARRRERNELREWALFGKHIDGICDDSKCSYCEIDRLQALNPKPDPWAV